jgi:hypothetical protein
LCVNFLIDTDYGGHTAFPAPIVHIHATGIHVPIACMARVLGSALVDRIEPIEESLEKRVADDTWNVMPTWIACFLIKLWESLEAAGSIRMSYLLSISSGLEDSLSPTL